MVINPDTWVEVEDGSILLITEHPDTATRTVNAYDIEGQVYRPIPVDSIVNLFN